MQGHLVECASCRVAIATAAAAPRHASSLPGRARGGVATGLKYVAVLASLAAIGAAWRYGDLLRRPATRLSPPAPEALADVTAPTAETSGAPRPSLAR